LKVVICFVLLFLFADYSRPYHSLGHEKVCELTLIHLKNNGSRAFKILVIFFPQMKPEKVAIAMTDDEKIVFNILKTNSPIDLNELKSQSELSQ